MKRTFTFLLTALFLSMGMTVKADFVQGWTKTPSPWTDEVVTDYPEELDWSTGTNGAGQTVTDHGTEGHSVRKAETSVVVSEATDIEISFQWGGGSHSLWVLGVDIIDSDNQVVKSHYALKQTGGNGNVITYTLASVPAGAYKMRYFICDKDADHEVTLSEGVITVKGKVAIEGGESVSVVYSAADLSNSKVYTVSTNDRGSWLYSSEKKALTSTTKAGVDVNAEDPNQQFAFITVKNQVYLYSVGAEKFVLKSGDYTTVSEDPEAYVTLISSGNANCPVVVALNGVNHMGVSNNYECGVITFWNDLKDGGNQSKIVAVAEKDLSSVVSAIELYLNKEAQELLVNAEELYNKLKTNDCAEVVALGDALTAAKNSLTDENIAALEAAYNVAVEFPFINGMVKDLEAGDYLVYYTDENNVKHYLQSAAANSVVTVTEGAKTYEITAGATAGGKYSKSVFMKMNDLYISNTNSNGTQIETKPNDNGTPLWISQVVFEKDGKCAIRLTNATAMDQWHGYFFVGKGEAEGTTIALDPAASLEDALFIWQFEKVTEMLTYTLTDELGNTYTGTYEGVPGTDQPTLSGVAGYTLSNEAWNGASYTANIAFPFPISNEETTNATMISNFNEGQRWHAVGANVKVQTAEPVYAEKNDWLWAIYPAFNEGVFTFTVKNLGKEQFVKVNAEENSFDTEGTITLAEEGTALEVVSWLNAPCFKVPGKTLYLTINGAGDTDVYLATWGGGNNNHGGNKLYFSNFVEVETIAISGYESALTEVGATVQLTATVTPENATSKAVTWSSSDESVATVDANGVVTAVANGKATITAAAGGKTATCEVTVAIEEPETPETPEEPETPATSLSVVRAMVGDVEIVEGVAEVTSISTIDIVFDRPVALAENAGWATLTDKWGPTNLDVKVLEAAEGSSEYVVRFSVSAEFNGEFVDAGEYVLNIPVGFIVGAEDASYANAAIEAVITIEGGSDTPAASLNVTNVTVGEDVMEGFTVVATTRDMIKVNFDGMFYYQGMPSIVDAENNDASDYFEFVNGMDYDDSNSYILKGKKVGIYTITLAKSSFMVNEYMPMYKAPAEDIVLTVQIVEAPVLPIVRAMVGDVEIVDGAATVESISSFEITFDRPVALAEDAEWAQLTDQWGDNSLKAEVLEENNCVVRFSLQWDVFTDAGDYYLYIPEAVVVGAEDANYANAAIEAVITIAGSENPDTPATPLAVVNVTVGEDVMEGFTVVATTEDMIKINFDGKFYFQGSPVIVDAEGQEAPTAFEYMNGLDMDGSNSYILMGKTEGIYTITLPKSQFNEFEMMGWKAPAEDIVLTVQITLPEGIENIKVDAETVIYDLSGRRVNEMVKGIYIVNGKKVIVK